MIWTDFPSAPPPGTEICALADLADGIGTAFDFPAVGEAKPFRLFIVRQGDDAWAYVNACSHFGVELNPGKGHTFLTPDGAAIRCQHHGAQFAIEDGRCLKGDCDGVGLTPIPLTRRDGRLLLGAPQP